MMIGDFALLAASKTALAVEELSEEKKKKLRKVHIRKAEQ